MKLAFVTELFAPKVVISSLLRRAGRELVKRGVDLFTIRHDLTRPKHETRGGMDIHRITDCANYKHPRLRRHPAGILRFTRDLWRRRAELQACDAVVFNIWPILPPLVLSRLLRGKAVIDICETRSGRAWHWIYQQLATLPGARILGVSPEIVRHMQRVHGVNARRAHSGSAAWTSRPQSRHRSRRMRDSSSSSAA